MFLSFVEKTKLPVFVVVFLFFAGSEGIAEDRGDAFVVGSISDARTLLPIIASDSASQDVCSMIFNGLVKYDKNLDLVGDLAQSWEVKEGGLVLVFHLRRNVSWQDGRPFTAKDVEFTYRQLINPSVRTPYSGDFERIKTLEALDDYTIRVTYKELFAPALSSWGMFIIPKHILEKQDLNSSTFQRKPVGTGPYVFKKWKSQNYIELLSSNTYFEKVPFISRYITRVIPDESTMFLELETEGLDAAGISALQYKRQTDTDFFKKKYYKFRLPSFSYLYLGYNLERGLFKDRRVREALNYAVNKQELIDMVLLGYGSIANGPFVPQSWAYDAQFPPAAFNQAKARSLLNDAGWKDDNFDGILEKDAVSFEFSILTNQGNEERIKAAQIIQKRLKEVGVRVKIKVVEWSVFLTEIINKRDFDAVLLGWSLSRDPDNFDIWHSSKIKPGEFNFIGYRNKEVDELLVQARKTFDQEKRKNCYFKINKLIYRDQPCMFLYVADNLFVVHKRFRNIEPGPSGIWHNFIYWWVPNVEQKYRSKSAIVP
ncbi:MAG: peptide-binding protein [Candidatus Omnitrophota bacterium]|nr:MAG: peptide-binding protein [Candidatus Omnitrophota bacterium]